MMLMIKRLLLLAVFLVTTQVVADDAAPLPVLQTEPQIGDCAIFREGGGGRIFKAPTYWLKGTIAAMSAERRMAGRCPEMGKPISAYQQNDWVRIAASTPCVHTDAEVREVDVLRIQLRVDSWETPWSYQHGTTGWLFRGYFLDKALKKDLIIDMDVSWLERCELRP